MWQTSWLGAILLTEGTISELWINLRRSSWLHLTSLNGKHRWRYYWEKNPSTEWLWQQKQIPVQLQRRLNGTTRGMRPMVSYVWAYSETSFSIKMEKEVSGYAQTQETIGLIPPIVPFYLLCSYIGLCFCFHSHSINAFHSQHYLHLCFPFK